MKKLSWLLAIVFLVGCTPWSDFIAEEEFILKDPHFQKYQNEIEKTEWQYLRKEIDYAEYRRRRAELDEVYDREVRERELILQGEL